MDTVTFRLLLLQPFGLDHACNSFCGRCIEDSPQESDFLQLLQNTNWPMFRSMIVQHRGEVGVAVPSSLRETAKFVSIKTNISATFDKYCISRMMADISGFRYHMRWTSKQTLPDDVPMLLKLLSTLPGTEVSAVFQMFYSNLLKPLSDPSNRPELSKLC